MPEPGAKLERIAIFRALQLGDMLCSVPALRALRAANPAARIALIGLPWAGEFAARYRHYFDEFIAFPGHPAFPEREPLLEEFPAFLETVQRAGFDLAIQLHGSGQVANALVALFGARNMAGFSTPGAFCAGEPGFIPWPDDLPEIERYLALTSHLGFEPQGTDIDLPVTAGEMLATDTLIREFGLRAERLVCIHPGARLPSRRWPAERFAEVARALLDRGFDVAVTGSESEAPIVASVAAATRGARNLCGKTSFGVLAALVSRARLLVSNDTGLSHVAAATRTPSVIVASGSDVHRWRPLDSTRHIVHFHEVECRPCAFHECPIGHPCALAVGTPEVIASALTLLERSVGMLVQPVWHSRLPGTV